MLLYKNLFPAKTTTTGGMYMDYADQMLEREELVIEIAKRAMHEVREGNPFSQVAKSFRP